MFSYSSWHSGIYYWYKNDCYLNIMYNLSTLIFFSSKKNYWFHIGNSSPFLKSRCGVNIYIIYGVLRLKFPEEQWLHLKNANLVFTYFKKSLFAMPVMCKQKGWLLGERGNQVKG